MSKFVKPHPCKKCGVEINNSRKWHCPVCDMARLEQRAKKRRECAKKWIKKNPEKRLLYNRRWKEKNAEHVRQWNIEYKAEMKKVGARPRRSVKKNGSRSNGKIDSTE